MTVVEYLQKNIEYIRVCLFNLIKEDHRVRISPHLFTELPALIVADIAWRRADHPGYTVLFHVLRHVHADHGMLCSKHSLAQRLGQLCLSHSSRPEKQEGANRPLWILESHSASSDSLGHGYHCLLLAYHALVKHRLQFQKPF